MSELINQITFVYVIALLIAGLITAVTKDPYTFPIILLIASIYLTRTFYQIFLTKKWNEGFKSIDDTNELIGDYFEIGGSITPASCHPQTLPTARNPFMNVLLDELKYNPKRAKAASVQDPSTKVTLDDFFRTEFYNDPTDVFGKTQSQRQFITMPSTSIPNDQDSYQNWLYRIPGKTCKEGGREACLPGTDGGALPWLNAER